MTEENEENRGPGPSRRTVVKGAAWSVPVIAAAFAAPAQAASGCTTQIGADKTATTSAVNLTSAAPAVSALVPAGATRMHFVVVGGGGGYSGYTTSGFLRGAYIEGDITVTAGTTYYLLAGAGGGAGTGPYGGTGQGGKSLYGNGGDGGSGAGFGGGGASAIVPGNATDLASAIVVAGGGGGLNISQAAHPILGSPSPLYSATMYHDQALSNGFQGYGGLANAGVPSSAGTAAAGMTGGLGWLGTRASQASDPLLADIVVVAGGGRGGQAVANGAGAGGVAGYVSGTPDWGGYYITPGYAGSGHNGGAGAANGGTPASTGYAGGGGGGYGGGGGGSTTLSLWNRPPTGYKGVYGITGAGGGGSSYVSPSVQNLTAKLDGRTTGQYVGTMGYVTVQFFAC